MFISASPCIDKVAMTPRKQQQCGRWLIAAIQNGRLSRAEELIIQGADLTVCLPTGDTALYAALAYAHYALVPLLLQQGADPNFPGPHGSYPLHLAAEFGGEHAPALLEALLRHSARVDVRDDEGATPTFLAGKAANLEAVQTLLRHGADLNDQNHERDTVLTFACCWGMTEWAATLLELGIDLHARDDAEMTALSWAARGGHTDTIELLLRHGAEVDVVDCWGRTPLMYAAHHGSARSVALLLEAGADPQARDQEGASALDGTREFHGRDLAEAITAQMQTGACGSLTKDVPLLVEREATPTGETLVQVGAYFKDGGGVVSERHDDFDAVVSLLEVALGNGRPG